jgi:hypothetical protein
MSRKILNIIFFQLYFTSFRNRFNRSSDTHKHLHSFTTMRTKSSLKKTRPPENHFRHRLNAKSIFDLKTPKRKRSPLELTHSRPSSQLIQESIITFPKLPMPSCHQLPFSPAFIKTITHISTIGRRSPFGINPVHTHPRHESDDSACFLSTNGLKALDRVHGHLPS